MFIPHVNGSSMNSRIRGAGGPNRPAPFEPARAKRGGVLIPRKPKF
jgi:hypothetical protein